MVGGNVHGRGGLRVARLVLVGLATATVVACSSNSTSTPGGTTGVPGSSSPTSAPPSPVSPADSARQRATAAYAGMWQAMVKAGETSDWQSPELAKYATGDALGVITRSLYTDHLNGVVTKGAPLINPQVSSVDPQDNPTTVMISDCGDSTNSLKYKKDGQLLNDTPGGKRAITAEVKKQPDGSWRVTRFAVEGLGSC
ncbi:hypothetical protein LWC34_54315 [Kibdelosporangium philippinense]|uniref:Secreted protein/lipoprotein n=1 Tax=Kibdelosporangium philippinense TaxID=211113 RepID=A0ABS8ZVH3_9PSEU|nr:hypothetical protein [Kibdelosporangium philippinense]MCE7011734.1 hypothetical protein [Kibdelosporangium philippinense]